MNIVVLIEENMRDILNEMIMNVVVQKLARELQ